MIVSHAFFKESSFIRGSILDITDTDIYHYNLTYIGGRDIPFNNNGVLDIDTGFYGFSGLSPDNLGKQSTYFNTPEFSYNITWETTSQPLLNGGGNAFWWGSGNTTEASLPACATTGTITLNGTELIIDPANSLTWYDRQISNGVPIGNWTWFELHFPNDIKFSGWAVDSGEPFPGNWRFATVRDANGYQIIMPFTFTPDPSSIWTSPASNLSYPLAWNLEFPNGDSINIKSVRQDQELYGPRVIGDTAYAGYIEATGSFMGQESGFGVVEMVRIA